MKHNVLQRESVKLLKEANDSQRKNKLTFTVLGMESSRVIDSKLIVKLQFFKSQWQ